MGLGRHLYFTTLRLADHVLHYGKKPVTSPCAAPPERKNL